MTPSRLTARAGDGFALAMLAALLATLGWAVLRSPVPPFEDAAILLRYAQHLAQGHGIVWNVGERPADGGTDLLFMILVAGLARLGIGIEAAARGLALAAHALTVLLVYAGARRLHGAHPLLALPAACFVALGPGWRYAEAYFGTGLFALLAVATWYLAYRLRERPGSAALAVLFSLSAFATGLARPEGVFLTALMVAALLFATGVRPNRKLLFAYLAVFGLLGSAYLLWRWRYFGHLLPTPFHKKGGGVLHWDSLRESARAACRLCFPLLLLAPLALRSRDALRRLAFALVPVAGFVLIWVLLSNEMNYLLRFQYAIVPLAVLSLPDWLGGLRRDLGLPGYGALPGRARLAAAAFLLTVAGAVLALQGLLYRQGPPARDGRYDLARKLAAFSGRNYTLVTTEAGLLPFYSRWRAIDAWGLNDLQIARHGLTVEDLERERPELIVFHAYFSPAAPAASGQDAWSRMVATLHGYAEANGYVLAAAYGVCPAESHYYFVRPDFPESGAIIGLIREGPYAWFGDGRASLDWAGLAPALRKTGSRPARARQAQSEGGRAEALCSPPPPRLHYAHPPPTRRGPAPAGSPGR